MLDVLKTGTIEPLVVDMRDRLQNITDMATVTNLRFDVKDMDDTAKMSNVVPTTDGMKVICLIDTTVGTWPNGEYKLYIKFTDGSAAVVLPAGHFRVEDD